MTIKGSKLLVFLSFLTFVFITLFFISSPAFANHRDDHNKNDDNRKDEQDVVFNLPSGGTNIVNNNENTNKNENKNDITITNTNEAQSVQVATVPKRLPETGAPLGAIFTFLGAVPVGFKLSRFKKA